jgi:hypothetical protein
MFQHKRSTCCCSTLRCTEHWLQKAVCKTVKIPTWMLYAVAGKSRHNMLRCDTQHSHLPMQQAAEHHAPPTDATPLPGLGSRMRHSCCCSCSLQKHMLLLQRHNVQRMYQHGPCYAAVPCSARPCHTLGTGPVSSTRQQAGRPRASWGPPQHLHSHLPVTLLQLRACILPVRARSSALCTRMPLLCLQGSPHSSPIGRAWLVATSFAEQADSASQPHLVQVPAAKQGIDALQGARHQVAGSAAGRHAANWATRSLSSAVSESFASAPAARSSLRFAGERMLLLLVRGCRGVTWRGAPV